ncbi:MAG TPA: Asp-tRNA(Asn)/Glu-tRNA(Gln) amidotransferase subunit GatB [Phycisphaerales bacterium]|nr:Asp-tRNA(Asn)/Glu-tRNA(Gln) amidotransferase subunit GatB [Phycisphaerales bacterium]
MSLGDCMAGVTSIQLKIGMEIHVELATRSKMFTRAANVAHPDFFDAPPNSVVDAVVAALPGTLPVMNRRAIELSVMVGLALNCRIASHSKWDRKNYFYPDLPKGYQISQYDLPLCFDGEVLIPLEDDRTLRVGIIRAHLEEDAGKLGHELPGGVRYEGSLVDLNRAGTPLLEIVTHPDLSSADDAVLFARELRNICRFLNVTEGVMQRGHMRFEPNINLIIQTDDGRQYATPIVEVKNLNSFKSLHGAIVHEEKRQLEQWKKTGETLASGNKSTRGWDDVKGITVLQREKEEAHDYRYFPDPDLLPVEVDEAWLKRIEAEVPELPMQRRQRYRENYHLSQKDANALTDDRDVCLFYEACIAALEKKIGTSSPARNPGRECAVWVLNAGAKRANERGCGVHELGITPEHIAQIVELREANVIGSSAADELFGLLCEADEHETAEAVAAQHGLLQVRDERQLDEWVAEAIAAHAQAATDFASGKDAALGRLTGHIMKISKGRADAKAAQEKLVKLLRG